MSTALKVVPSGKTPLSALTLTITLPTFCSASNSGISTNEMFTLFWPSETTISCSYSSGSSPFLNSVPEVFPSLSVTEKAVTWDPLSAAALMRMFFPISFSSTISKLLSAEATALPSLSVASTVPSSDTFSSYSSSSQTMLTFPPAEPTFTATVPVSDSSFSNPIEKTVNPSTLMVFVLENLDAMLAAAISSSPPASDETEYLEIWNPSAASATTVISVPASSSRSSTYPSSAIEA